MVTCVVTSSSLGPNNTSNLPNVVDEPTFVVFSHVRVISFLKYITKTMWASCLSAEIDSEVNSRSSGEGVLFCISKANGHAGRSFLYVSQVDISDERIEPGNPVNLVYPGSETDVWENTDVRRENLCVGKIVKFVITENRCVYDGKTEKRMVSCVGTAPTVKCT